MPTINIGPLNQRISIEKKVVTQDPDYGTELVTWTPLATVWANIVDNLPSNSEAVKDGLAMAADTSVMIIRFRGDVDTSMRIIAYRPNRLVYQIIAGPAEIGKRQYLEFGVSRYSS